jgi:hypothetical protein
VVTKDNSIHFLNKLVEKFDSENETTGVKTVKNHIFNGGDIDIIGGNYRNKFAIVKN